MTWTAKNEQNARAIDALVSLQIHRGEMIRLSDRVREHGPQAGDLEAARQHTLAVREAMQVLPMVTGDDQSAPH